MGIRTLVHPLSGRELQTHLSDEEAVRLVEAIPPEKRPRNVSLLLDRFIHYPHMTGPPAEISLFAIHKAALLKIQAPDLDEEVQFASSNE